MGKNDAVIEKLSKDLDTLYENSRQAESRSALKMDALEDKVGENNTDIQLLAKDVKASISSMADFMQLFEKHDEKEMEKYDSIESSLQALDKKVDGYITKTDAHTEDMKWLKEVAAKGKLYMIRGTWTVTLGGMLFGLLVFVHPFAKEYFISQAASEGRLNTKYTDEQKKEYYKRMFNTAIEAQKNKDK